MFGISCRWICWCPHTPINVRTVIPWKVPYLWRLRLKAFNHLWTYQVSFMYPSALVSLILSIFLAEHVAGQFRHVILVVSWWMEASWLHTILNMLADFSLVSNCKGACYGCFNQPGAQGYSIVAFNPLAVQRCLERTRVLSLSLSGIGADLSVYDKSLSTLLERMGWVVCLQGCTKQCHICP